jgi:hypothetical protein
VKERRARIKGRRAPSVVLCASGVVAAVLIHSAPAGAAEQVGIYVEGPEASEVRDVLAGGAPKGVTVAPADALPRALAGGGQRGPFVKKLDGKTHDAEVRHMRDAMAVVGLDAVLLGRVRREGTRRRVRLILIDRAGVEQELPEVVYEPPPDGGGPDADLVSRAGQAFESYSHPPQAAAPDAAPDEPAIHPEPASGNAGEPADTGRDSSEPRTRGVFNRSLFDVEVGGDAVGRRFEYRDGISENLRSYSVAPAAMVSAGADVFPFAGASGVLRDIGLTGSYARSLFLQSALAGGTNLRSVESAYSFGFRIRTHPWGDGGALLGASYEYAAQSFIFDSVGASVDGQVPSVDYRANRIGINARIPFGSFALVAGAGFRAVLSAGEVASRFRSPSTNGVDGTLGASLTVASGWEARLLFDYERYFYGFQPAPGDGYVAGGALDQFFGGRLAVAYVY